MKVFKSINFKVTATILFLMTVGILSFLILIYPKVETELESLVKKHNLTFSKYLAQTIDQEIKDRILLLETLSKTIPKDIIVKKDKLSSWLCEREYAKSKFNYGLVVVQADGSKIYGESPVIPGRDKLVFTQSEWFQKTLISTNVILSKPFLGRVGKQPIMIFAKSIREASGDVVAVLYGVVSLNENGFMKFIYNNKIGDSGGFLVISPKDKLFVASNKAQMVLKHTPKKGVNLLHDKAMAGYRGTGITKNAYGVTEISAISSIPTPEWFLVVRMPIKEAYQALYSINTIFINAILINIFVVAFFIAFAVYYLLKPLKQSAIIVNKMATGESKLKQLPIKQDDEIGRLLNGFNLLVEKVENDKKIIENISRVDKLTQLYNRMMIDEVLESEMKKFQRYKHPFSLLLIDIDNFKLVNDTYGHLVGDIFLKEFADILKTTCRETDTIGRWGGEEFIICSNSDLQGAVNLAEKIREKAEQFAFDRDKHTTISVGVSCVEIGDRLETLLKRVDDNLYKSKENGKNQVSAD